VGTFVADRRNERFQLWLVAVGPLQEQHVAAERLAARVAGDDFERAIRVDDGIFRLPILADENRVDARLDRTLEQQQRLGRQDGGIRISSNENPLGPGKAALDVLAGRFVEAGRYPFNAIPGEAQFAATIAQKFNAKMENVVIGAGSGEILRNAVRAFTSASKPLVTANPSFEAPFRTAEQIGTPVKYIPVDSNMRLDLEKMADACKGAGLVFFCNPNNPTATVHGSKAVAEFVARVRKVAPTTAILIDEAYYDYVTDPAFSTATPLALSEPNVFVTRTFSKAYGMAGLRLGYAVGQVKTINALVRYRMPYGCNVLGIGAATRTVVRLVKQSKKVSVASAKT